MLGIVQFCADRYLTKQINPLCHGTHIAVWNISDFVILTLAKLQEIATDFIWWILLIDIHFPSRLHWVLTWFSFWGLITDVIQSIKLSESVKRQLLSFYSFLTSNQVCKHLLNQSVWATLKAFISCSPIITMESWSLMVTMVNCCHGTTASFLDVKGTNQKRSENLTDLSCRLY